MQCTIRTWAPLGFPFPSIRPMPNAEECPNSCAGDTQRAFSESRGVSLPASGLEKGGTSPLVQHHVVAARLELYVGRSDVLVRRAGCGGSSRHTPLCRTGQSSRPNVGSITPHCGPGTRARRRLCRRRRCSHPRRRCWANGRYALELVDQKRAARSNRPFGWLRAFLWGYPVDG